MFSKMFLLLAMLSSTNANIDEKFQHPNVIIMHIKDLHWSDLGIHVDQKDSENSTPNIDYLAYSGIILNRFYANGGLDSLLSGCYQRSQYANKNLMMLYFERNGYNVNFIARNSHDKIEKFEKKVLSAISNDNGPFLTVADFGSLGDDIKIAFVDEIVGSVVTKAHKVGVLNETIILFLSLPDNNASPLEIDIRRTAFVYSPSLKLQQRVSNQMVQVIDLLPTLVNASNLKWRTRDRIYVDGINQWHALNTNDEERLDVYGNNFYISNYWKLTFGASNSENGFYGSIENEEMESNKDVMGYSFETYVNSIFSSELHSIFNKLSPQKVMFSKSRAKVHCNFKDFDESAIKNIKCSHSSPCLFNLLQDPCELDNKREKEFNLRRYHMKEILERYLSGESIDDIFVINISNSAAENSLEDGTVVGIILGGSILGFILVFIVVVCVKEKCNRRRSVYHAKVKKVKKTANGNSRNENDENAISVISRNVK